MTPGTAYLVDDDEAIRDALAWLLRSRNVVTKAWCSGESFLADYDPIMRGCILLDIRMHAMSGLECFDLLLQRQCSLPVIFVTGHGDVPQAVQAIKKGAFDFIEKPFNDNELANRVIAALEYDSARDMEGKVDASLEARLHSLSPREHEVMKLVLAGKFNKVIADELNIAMRTVEVHRSHVFEKMGVRSAIELAQILAKKIR
jgi:two-component system, LuxR family, response regulator DctR